MQIRDLPGLGPATEARLAAVGINSVEELRELGALDAYFLLYQAEGTPPNRNFLYALVGALDGRGWLAVAQQDKYRLMLEVEQMRDILEGTVQAGKTNDSDRESHNA